MEGLTNNYDEISYSKADLANATKNAIELKRKFKARTVNTLDSIDDEEFFTMEDGTQTITNRYDLEKAVSYEKKRFFKEEKRYWVNKPYAFVSIFHSTRENEHKYFLIEPHLNEVEEEAINFFTEKLRTSIRYSDDEIAAGESKEKREEVIEEQAWDLIDRFDYYNNKSVAGRIKRLLFSGQPDIEGIEGISARPEHEVIDEDSKTLSRYQIEKLLYYLKRDFIGYRKIDGITNDIKVEDISCDGYNQPVFVYHSEHEQLITNLEHGKETLDDFVISLAQRSGKGISKRNPQVDATLPNGSRAQLTLGREVSDHGTNYTIRQFKEVPFTPIDQINWETFSLNQMAFLWLAIENHRSLMFAGGTASGKTTALNAVSLFIPSNSKIVSIEDTREVELPQRNWIASITRPSFTGDGTGAVDEFDLLEAALRQRPDYIVFGEVRGEEGRSLFQVMSTGHTTYTTFHADNVGEVVKRFTTDPINVSKTLFTSLDLVSIHTQTTVDDSKVRKSKVITEINDYDPENDEINVNDIYEWSAENDEFVGFEEDDRLSDISTLKKIRFDRGWSVDELKDELAKRRIVLAHLLVNEYNTYAQVAATTQAFINDNDTVLTLIANDELGDELENLRQMENILIDVSQDDEESTPRPELSEEVRGDAEAALSQHQDILDEYEGKQADSLVEAIPSVSEEDRIQASPTEEYEFIDNNENTE
jgi:flagellar protein FlaI